MIRIVIIADKEGTPLKIFHDHPTERVQLNFFFMRAEGEVNRMQYAELDQTAVQFHLDPEYERK